MRSLSLANVPIKSVVGYLTLGLVFIFHYFGVDIKDEAPALGAAIANFANATATLVGVGLTLWGHIQLAARHGALKQIAFNAGAPAQVVNAPMVALAAVDQITARDNAEIFKWKAQALKQPPPPAPTGPGTAPATSSSSATSTPGVPAIDPIDK